MDRLYRNFLKVFPALKNSRPRLKITTHTFFDLGIISSSLFGFLEKGFSPIFFRYMFLSDFLFRVLFQVASCFLAASLLQGLLKAEPQGQIRPVRKIKNHSHLQCQGESVCALLRASGRAFAYEFSPKTFPHISANFRKMSAKFPQPSLAQ